MKRWVLVLSIVACGGQKTPGRDAAAVDAAVSPEVAALVGATDPAVASGAIRKLAAGGCPRLVAALAALDRARFGSRVFAGLVDDAVDAGGCAAAEAVPALREERGAAAALARARFLAADPGKALASLEGAPDAAAVRWRRAELLAEMGARGEAERELADGLKTENDPKARADLAWLEIADGQGAKALATLEAAPSGDADVERARVAALASAGRFAECADLIAAAQVDRRLELARAAAKGAADPEALAKAAGAVPEVLIAVAQRVRDEHGQAPSLDAFRRAAAAAPADPTALNGLAEALAASGKVDEAVAAWDRVIAISAAPDGARISAIGFLFGSGRRAQAAERARRMAKAARASKDADGLEAASTGAVAAHQVDEALALAREALAARPGDGRLAFLVAERLEDAGQASEAVKAWVELLYCGAHGHAYHRHEVAKRLVDAARAGGKEKEAMARLVNPEGECRSVETDDLEPYVQEAMSELRR